MLTADKIQTKIKINRESNRKKGMQMHLEHNHPTYACAYGQEGRVTSKRNC